MANDKPVSISENELNSVLNSIKDDNTKNICEDYKLGVGISQSELEKVLKRSSSNSEENSSASPKSDYEEKIAKRNAHAAEVMKQANALLPRTVSVIYGSVRKEASFLSGLKEGDSLDLDRLADENADILVNGKLFAHGILDVHDGHACVKITDIV
ncbi:MAG: FliM/FliN family flagellar motor switch protein [Treponema sp.]|nr:FliM/FliN family flagellar motor switch protein [Treponema sp.]